MGAGPARKEWFCFRGIKIDEPLYCPCANFFKGLRLNDQQRLLIFTDASSAKSRIGELVSVTIQLMSTRNNRGTRIESCGTPVLIDT